MSVNGIIKFFQDGGFFLYPLVIIFVVGVAIAVERWVYLTKETIKNRNLWDDVAPHLGAGNFKQAIDAGQQFDRADRHGAQVRPGASVAPRVAATTSSRRWKSRCSKSCRASRSARTT